MVTLIFFWIKTHAHTDTHLGHKLKQYTQPDSPEGIAARESMLFLYMRGSRDEIKVVGQHNTPFVVEFLGAITDFNVSF